MKPGNILQIKNPKTGLSNYWYVESVCLGAVKQESVIHISRCDGYSKPSCLGEERAMFVPELMISILIDSGVMKVYDKFPEHHQDLTA